MGVEIDESEREERVEKQLEKRSGEARGNDRG